MNQLKGDIEVYQKPQYRKKKKTNKQTKKQKGKYRYAVSKIDEIPIPHLKSVTLT